MVNYVGEVKISEINPLTIQATWKIDDFHNLSGGSGVSKEFPFIGYACHISANTTGPGSIRFSVLCMGSISSNPPVYCEFAVRTSEGTLSEVEIKEEEFHVTSGGTILFCEMPFANSSHERESLVPGGTLTVVCKLGAVAGGTDHEEPKMGASAKSETKNETLSESKATSAATQERDSGKGSIGELEFHHNSPTDLEITWKISDFFNLPATIDKGLSSKDFPIPGGEGFLVVHPFGTREKSDLVRIVATFLCSAQSGMRDPEMDCDVSLKSSEGTHFARLADEDQQCLGPSACAFFRFFSTSDIEARKESLVPGGTLTACVRIRSKTEAPGLTTGNLIELLSKLEVPSVSSASSESSDDDFEDDLKKLYFGGEDKDVTFRVDGEEFTTYMSILAARIPVFACEVHQRMKDEDTRTLDMDDLCSASAFRTFLQFAFTGKVENVSKQTAFELYVMADKFKLDELKAMCLNCKKTIDAGSADGDY